MYWTIWLFLVLGLVVFLMIECRMGVDWRSGCVFDVVRPWLLKLEVGVLS